MRSVLFCLSHIRAQQETIAVVMRYYLFGKISSKSPRTTLSSSPTSLQFSIVSAIGAFAAGIIVSPLRLIAHRACLNYSSRIFLVLLLKGEFWISL